jgi:hypothetical protein
MFQNDYLDDSLRFKICVGSKGHRADDHATVAVLADKFMYSGMLNSEHRFGTPCA